MVRESLNLLLILFLLFDLQMKIIIIIIIIMIIIIIITMFTQGNLFNTRSAVIKEGPVSITAINYNIINFKTKK